MTAPAVTAPGSVRRGTVAACHGFSCIGLTTISPLVSPPGMPSKTPPAPANPTLSYEQALAELERLVQRMEEGQLPLDQMLDGYRRGAELLELCRARLAAVEEQVRILEDGQLKPWTG